tara:strand:+ start:366 stop:1373 length:1008 start_codon:yes stop_codon:yes gene_type:complete
MPIRSNRNLTEYYDRFSYSGAGGPEPVASGGGSGSFVNGGARGIDAGGYDPNDLDTIDYVTIATTGNFTDFGDMQAPRRAVGCCSNGSRMCIGGGFDQNTNEGSYYQDMIGYITTSSTGNANDFGNLTVKRYALSALSNGTRGCWANGQDGTENPSVYKDVIDYVTIASTGNATDFGDTSYVGRAIFCAANDTRGLIGGGNVQTNRIEYITVATTGNASDFGDMLDSLYGYNAASASASRAVYTGGRAPAQTNVMGYMTIDTTGNATDFGDMYAARDGHGACTNGTRMLSTGGTTPASSYVTDVEYITIANTGNGTDFGDLTVGRWYTAASSGSA